MRKSFLLLGFPVASFALLPPSLVSLQKIVVVVADVNGKCLLRNHNNDSSSSRSLLRRETTRNVAKDSTYSSSSMSHDQLVDCATNCVTDYGLCSVEDMNELLDRKCFVCLCLLCSCCCVCFSLFLILDKLPSPSVLFVHVCVCVGKPSSQITQIPFHCL